MVKVNLIGFGEFEKRIKNASKTIVDEIAHEVIAAGDKIVQRAKREAPTNKQVGVGGSQLTGGITSTPTSKLSVEVVSAAAHSPYIEWGTITKVSVPPELSSYAQQFKGRGIRKNGGILPHPFFFKQLPVVRQMFTDNIKKILGSI